MLGYAFQLEYLHASVILGSVVSIRYGEWHKPGEMRHSNKDG